MPDVYIPKEELLRRKGWFKPRGRKRNRLGKPNRTKPHQGGEGVCEEKLSLTEIAKEVKEKITEISREAPDNLATNKEIENALPRQHRKHVEEALNFLVKQGEIHEFKRGKWGVI